ncbi:MAG TPA: hypothetical protein VIV60_14800 [Polyangiaceae bacterium]
MIQLSVPREALPESLREREQVVRQYFAQLSATITSTPSGWDIALDWTSDPAVYVDPHLAEGLSWWRHSIGPISVETIPTTHTQRDTYLLSIEDSWTVYSWSLWLQSLASRTLPINTTILHIDDHNDLMSPRLVVSESAWIDAITANPVSLFEPTTVAQAITSGAIGIGSFVAPLLHTLPRVDVRHLWATGARPSSASPMRLRARAINDGLLLPGAKRLAVTQDPVQPGPTDHCYRATNDLEVWLADIAAGPILLHVDMDYFNNRYNGDSAWPDNERRHDPILSEVLSRIDEVFAAMQSCGVLARVANTTVALSPGFFPAEFWADAIERITRYLGGKTL